MLAERRARLEEVESLIEKAEEEVRTLDESFCRPDFYDLTPASEVQSLTDRRTRLQATIDGLNAEWEELSTALEESAS